MDYRVILYLAVVTAFAQGFSCPKEPTGVLCIEGLYSNPVDCNSYYSCSHECRATLQHCPEGLHFHPDLGYCDYPALVNCVPTVGPTSSTPATTTTTTTPAVVITTDVQFTAVPEFTTVDMVITTTLSPLSTQPPSEGEVMFCSSRTQGLSGYSDPVDFPETVVIVGTGYSETTDTLTAPIDGYYFLSLSAGASPGQRINFNLRGDGPYADVFRYSNVHNGTDTTSRDVIMPLTAGQRVFVLNDAQSTVYSDQGRLTSFTGFNIYSYMKNSTAQAFCVGNQDVFALDTAKDVTFSEVLVNEGQAFDTENRSRIRVNHAGIYFLSLSSGLQANTPLRVQIQTANKGGLLELLRASNTHNGPDTFSKALLVSLDEGDYVKVRGFAGTLYSDAELQTSYTGFHYDPLSGQKAAWSVYSTLSMVVGDSPLDPLPFDKNLLQTNNIFNFDDYTVHISISGYYYVHFGVGVQGRQMVTVQLLRGQQEEARVERTSTSHSYMDTLGRSVLLEMHAGDTLRLVAGSHSALFSDADGQTSFCGFLLRPL